MNGNGVMSVSKLRVRLYEIINVGCMFLGFFFFGEYFCCNWL